MMKFEKLYTHYNKNNYLSKDLWSLFEQECQIELVGPGIDLSTFVDLEQDCIVINEGLAKVSLYDIEDKEYVHQFISTYDFFVPSYFKYDKSLKLKIVSLQKSEILIIKRSKLSMLCNEFIGWTKTFTSAITKSLILNQSRSSQLLTQSAPERYQSFINNSNSIFKEIPRYLVASYIGITPVALSRIHKTGKTTKY